MSQGDLTGLSSHDLEYPHPFPDGNRPPAAFTHRRLVYHRNANLIKFNYNQYSKGIPELFLGLNFGQKLRIVLINTYLSKTNED